MSNTFRKTYRELSPEEQELVEQIKDAAERLEMLYDEVELRNFDEGRRMFLALDKLEESVMWAVKVITT